MSDQKRNTGRTDDMDFSALDEELARMAEETPEVPADFHDSWTKMIREEAAAEKPETTAEESRKERGQLRYILSAAAAFVVLIGGVVIVRNNGLLKGTPTVSESPVLAASPLTAGKTSEAAEAVYEDAVVSAEQTVFLGMNADSMPAPEAEEMTAARKADAAESAQNSVLTAPMVMSTAMPAKPAAGAPETNAEADREGTVSMEAAAEEAETEAIAEAETEAIAEAETEETAEAETEEAPEEVPEESAGEPTPETAEDDGQGDTRSFLQRAWEGILDAVPWILSGAIIVLFILTYVVRPGKKK